MSGNNSKSTQPRIFEVFKLTLHDLNVLKFVSYSKNLHFSLLRCPNLKKFTQTYLFRSRALNVVILADFRIKLGKFSFSIQWRVFYYGVKTSHIPLLLSWKRLEDSFQLSAPSVKIPSSNVIHVTSFSSIPYCRDSEIAFSFKNVTNIQSS